MNTKQRIEYLKQMIDESRAEGLNNIANLYVDELIKANAEMVAEEASIDCSFRGCKDTVEYSMYVGQDLLALCPRHKDVMSSRLREVSA